MQLLISVKYHSCSADLVDVIKLSDQSKKIEAFRKKFATPDDFLKRKAP